MQICNMAELHHMDSARIYEHVLALENESSALRSELRKQNDDAVLKGHEEMGQVSICLWIL